MENDLKGIAQQMLVGVIKEYLDCDPVLEGKTELEILADFNRYISAVGLSDFIEIEDHTEDQGMLDVAERVGWMVLKK